MGTHLPCGLRLMSQVREDRPSGSGVRGGGEHLGVTEAEPCTGTPQSSPRTHTLSLPPWPQQAVLTTLQILFQNLLCPSGHCQGSATLNGALWPLCSAPGRVLGSSMAVLSLEEQNPEAQEDQGSHGHPDEVPHCVVLWGEGRGCGQRGHRDQGRSQSPQNPGHSLPFIGPAPQNPAP